MPVHSRIPLNRLAALGYALALVYGTLYPFSEWTAPDRCELLELVSRWPTQISLIDLATNLLIYLPLGFFLFWPLRPRFGSATAVAVATTAGACVSFALEIIQVFIPARVTSLLDLIANTLGTAIGAIAASSFVPELLPGRYLQRWRGRWLRDGRTTYVGVAALGLWAVSQLSPFVPSADLGFLKTGLRPVWSTFRNPALFDFHRAAVYVLAVCGLGLLASVLIRPNKNVSSLFSAAVLGVLFLKIPVMTRQLSSEALVGSAGGLLLFALLRQQARPTRAFLSAGCVLGSYIADGLRSSTDALQRFEPTPMNWVPFADYRVNLFDVADILGSAWPAVALAYLVRTISRHDRAPAALLAGSAFLFGISFLLESAQRRLPGRTPDISDCLVVVLFWSVAWFFVSSGRVKRP